MNGYDHVTFVYIDDRPQEFDSSCSHVCLRSARLLYALETFQAPRTLPDVLLSCAGVSFLCAQYSGRMKQCAVGVYVDGA
jgi:hypothetical protein